VHHHDSGVKALQFVLALVAKRAVCTFTSAKPKQSERERREVVRAYLL
jgi:hypothetical protein